MSSVETVVLSALPTSAWAGAPLAQVRGQLRVECEVGRLNIEVDSSGRPLSVRRIALCEWVSGVQLASWQRPVGRTRGGITRYTLRLLEGAVREGKRYALVVDASFDGAPVTTVRSDAFVAL